MNRRLVITLKNLCLKYVACEGSDDWKTKVSLQAVEIPVMKYMRGFWNQAFCIQNLAPAFISSKSANYFILCVSLSLVVRENSV